MRKDERQLRLELKLAWEQEELHWKQRSRVDWLVAEDPNTKFFHSITIQRRLRNQILKIKNREGEWLEEDTLIKEEVITHFRDIYTREQIMVAPEIFHCIERIETDEMNSSLMAPIREKEAKVAVFNLGKLKALGQEGFLGFFFQKNWE